MPYCFPIRFWKISITSLKAEQLLDGPGAESLDFCVGENQSPILARTFFPYIDRFIGTKLFLPFHCQVVTTHAWTYRSGFYFTPPRKFQTHSQIISSLSHLPIIRVPNAGVPYEDPPSIGRGARNIPHMLRSTPRNLPQRHPVSISTYVPERIYNAVHNRAA